MKKKRLLWAAILLAVWEISVKLSHISPLLFPSVEEVLKTLYQDLFHGDLLIQTLSSLEIIGIGMLLAAFFAIVLSLFSLFHPLAEGLIDTITTIAHPLPGLALLPLIIIWFGTGDSAIIAIIVHSALWP
ncbi:MAG: ABC transporter permease, partial [Acetivibrio ethanolgignens]